MYYYDIFSRICYIKIFYFLDKSSHKYKSIFSINYPRHILVL